MFKENLGEPHLTPTDYSISWWSGEIEAKCLVERMLKRQLESHAVWPAFRTGFKTAHTHNFLTAKRTLFWKSFYAGSKNSSFELCWFKVLPVHSGNCNHAASRNSRNVRPTASAQNWQSKTKDQVTAKCYFQRYHIKAGYHRETIDIKVDFHCRVFVYAP